MNTTLVDDRFVYSNAYWAAAIILFIPAVLMTFQYTSSGFTFNLPAAWLFFWPIWIIGIGYERQRQHSPDRRIS